MECKQCGNSLPENAKFCPECGAPVPADDVVEETPSAKEKVEVVEEVIERQLRKYKNKLVEKHQAGVDFSKSFVEDHDHDSVEDDSIQIIRTKRFGIKPMFPEDACIQMELLGHNFYVFTNAETDEVNVVYKRKNNTYGLIEPEFQ